MWRTVQTANVTAPPYKLTASTSGSVRQKVGSYHNQVPTRSEGSCLPRLSFWFPSLVISWKEASRARGRALLHLQYNPHNYTPQGWVFSSRKNCIFKLQIFHPNSDSAMVISYNESGHSFPRQVSHEWLKTGSRLSLASLWVSPWQAKGLSTMLPRTVLRPIEWRPCVLLLRSPRLRLVVNALPIFCHHVTLNGFSTYIPGFLQIPLTSSIILKWMNPKCGSKGTKCA